MSEKEEMRRFFRELKKQGIRVEDVAARLKVSYSAVRAWSDGRATPNFLSRKYLNEVYGPKVKELA